MDSRSWAKPTEVTATEDRATRGTAVAPVRIRVASNIAKLSRDAVEGVEVEVRPLPSVSGLGATLRAIPALIGALSCDVVIVDQDQRLLFPLCLLRWLMPWKNAPIVVVDLLLSKPGPGLWNRLKTFAMTWLFRKLDLLLLFQKNVQGLQEHYGIPPEKCRYIPFKINTIELVLATNPPEGSYVFSSGRSYRDYQTLCDAVAGLDYPTKILTPKAHIGAVHGTHFNAQNAPPHVQIVHDDGSRQSLIDYMANARIVVLPVSPGALFPASVGTYIMAMALKKCVIITDSLATQGILDHEENAIMVPMQDADALREAIRKAWEDDEYRRRIAQNGYEYALSLGGEEKLYANIVRTTMDFLRSQGRLRAGNGR